MLSSALSFDGRSTVDRATIDTIAARCDRDIGRALRRARGMSLTGTNEIEVTTSHGIGFMFRLNGRYRPRINLAEVAVRVADRLEAGGTYEVTSLDASSLPSIWFDDRRSALEHEQVSACIFLSIQPVQRPEAVSGPVIFVAEASSPDAAATLAAHAEALGAHDGRQAAGSRGSVLLVIGAARSVHTGQAVETRRDLQAIRDSLLAAATPTPHPAG
jgi:hypothetical protein